MTRSDIEESNRSAAEEAARDSIEVLAELYCIACQGPDMEWRHALSYAAHRHYRAEAFERAVCEYLKRHP